MSDAFFSNPRPFTKRKREDAPASSRSGTSARRGNSSERGGSRGRGGAPRGGRGGARGASNGSSRGGRGGGKFGDKLNGRGGKQGKDQGGKRRAQEDNDDDDELDVPDGGFDSDSGAGESDEIESEEEEDDESETPAQKRLRLSQMYLKTLEKETLDDIGFDAADLDRDLIAERLQQDVLEHAGKLHLSVASSVEFPIASSSIHHTPSKAHRGPVTSAVASSDGNWLYTSSKDGSIIKWDLRALFTPPTSASSSPPIPARITKAVFFPKRISLSERRNPEKAEEKGKGKADGEEPGHTSDVLTLALSLDGKVLASGGRDKVIGVWNVEGEKGSWVRGLAGHKDQVASLAFRIGTQQLYSSSFDRTVKVFDLSTLSYVETLFGHQDCIQSITSLRAETAVSAGGRDKTLRFWKITEESQLVFRGGVASRIRNVLDGAMEDEGLEDEDSKKRKRSKGEIRYVEGSVDCVSMVDDSTFLSGGDSGSICLWSITKKKPVFTAQLAHGENEYASESEGVIGTARWITALACLPYGDIFASGSWDGSIRLWKIDASLRSFSALGTIPALGFINSLQLQLVPVKEDGKNKTTRKKKNLVIVGGVGKEPRIGRWMKIREGKEGSVVAVLPCDAE